MCLNARHSLFLFSPWVVFHWNRSSQLTPLRALPLIPKEESYFPASELQISTHGWCDANFSPTADIKMSCPVQQGSTGKKEKKTQSMKKAAAGINLWSAVAIVFPSATCLRIYDALSKGCLLFQEGCYFFCPKDMLFFCIVREHKFGCIYTLLTPYIHLKGFLCFFFLDNKTYKGKKQKA